MEASHNGDPSRPEEDVDQLARQPGETETATPRRRLKALLPGPVWQAGRLLLLALIIEYLVVPQLAGPRKLVHLLAEVNPLLLLAGIALEAGALASYAELTRTVMPSERLSFWVVFRIQLTTLSVSHCTPGGTATGTALGYRLLTQAGATRGAVGFALGMQGIGSAVVLNVILWIALIVSIPVWGFSAVYLIAAGVGAVLMLAAITLLILFTKAQQRAAESLEIAARKLPFVDGAALRRTFEQIAGRLQTLGHDRGLLVRALSWATANWLLDAASLEVFVGAFGKWVNPDGLLVAYGLANVLAAIPLTPGGLGVVEATATSLLVGFDTPRGIATLGVIAYRLINFWLPIPVGGLAYLSLQMGSGGRSSGGNSWRARMVSKLGRPLERPEDEDPSVTSASDQ